MCTTFKLAKENIGIEENSPSKRSQERRENKNIKGQIEALIYVKQHVRNWKEKQTNQNLQVKI